MPWWFISMLITLIPWIAIHLLTHPMSTIGLRIILWADRRTERQVLFVFIMALPYLFMFVGLIEWVAKHLRISILWV